jgi:predicted Rossmann fold flavoprotein
MMLSMQEYDVMVIGGGAAGICAAIEAARCGKKVIIGEKTSQIGKKLLATGNGRCNLLNEKLDESFYNTAARPLVKSVFTQFGKSAILKFFEDLGLRIYSKEGRYFPVTNQASSVLKVLDLELQRLGVPVKYGFGCNHLEHSNGKWEASSISREKMIARKVVLCGGGKTYPAYGADGSAYALAVNAGHKLVEPVPAVVPLLVKDPLCNALQGQRINALACAEIKSKLGEAKEGELLFTQYGLSGTCILDISEAISVAINREHLVDVNVVIDMVPFMGKAELLAELVSRHEKGWAAAEMLTGILPNKIAVTMKSIFEKSDVESAVDALKSRRFKVSGTRGWNEAEFTSGGIITSEVDALTLESKLHKGLFLAGEILDVNGARGGYNLAWAWASGMEAGNS